MSRNTNNELAALPGFFYHPHCAEDLVKLTDQERFDLLENQGNYAVTTYRHEEKMKGELLCVCDNGRIPTHRRPGAVIPGFGKVPLDLREVIDLKGV